MKTSPENDVLAAALSKRLDACFCDDVGQLPECERCLKIRELLTMLSEESAPKPADEAPPPEFADLFFKAAVSEQYRRWRAAFDRTMEINARVGKAVRLGIRTQFQKELDLAQANEKHQNEDLLMLIGGLIGQYDEESNARLRKFAFGLVRDAGVTWIKPVDAPRTT